MPEKKWIDNWSPVRVQSQANLLGATQARDQVGLQMINQVLNVQWSFIVVVAVGKKTNVNVAYHRPSHIENKEDVQDDTKWLKGTDPDANFSNSCLQNDHGEPLWTQSWKLKWYYVRQKMNRKHVPWALPAKFNPNAAKSLWWSKPSWPPKSSFWPWCDLGHASRSKLESTSNLPPGFETSQQRRGKNQRNQKLWDWTWLSPRTHACHDRPPSSI